MAAQAPDKVVILARGMGSRMRRGDSSAGLDERQAAVADSGVKALIPIDRPFLDYVLSRVADAGYRRVCLVIGPEHARVFSRAGWDKARVLAEIHSHLQLPGAEIIRGAVEQTSFGEVEAAKACGMSKATLYRRIILPSAFRRALPAYGNEVIFMLHGSVIAGVITIVDLFGAAKIVNSRHFVPFESFIAAGFFYLGLTFLIVWGFKMWEKHWHAHLRPRES